MSKVIIVGGGVAGCAAALSAKKAGVEDVILLERTDSLTGNARAAGIMANNGRFTAEEEMKFIGGGGEIFEDFRACALHEDLEFPGHKHAYMSSIFPIEQQVLDRLTQAGIKIMTEHRATDVMMDGDTVTGIKVKTTDEAKEITGDVFIDATGSAGGQAICTKYGSGCSCCTLRCPTFGRRVPIGQKAGVDTYSTTIDGEKGVISGAFGLVKDTLPPKYREKLNEDGFFAIPFPEGVDYNIVRKACSQYHLDEFEEKIIVMDSGEAKVMLQASIGLNQIPLFQESFISQPLAAPQRNSTRFVNVHFKDDYLKANEVANLFFGGESGGLHVGITEAIVTGALAGHNAARMTYDRDLVKLPEETAVGHYISWVNEVVEDESAWDQRYTFSGAKYFDAMKEKGLYTSDREKIRKRVEDLDLTGFMNKSLG